MIEELVSRVFFTRNAAHLAHWAANGLGSYSKHVALGDFYDSLIDNIDEIVEAYQGRFGLIGRIPAPPVQMGDILAQIQDDLSFIESNRDGITQGNNSVGNLLDTLAHTYQLAIYKLTNLH